MTRVSRSRDLRSGFKDHSSALIGAGRVARAVVLSLKHRALDGIDPGGARFLERAAEQARGWREGQLERVGSVVHELAARAERDGVAAVRQVAAAQQD